MNPSACRWHLWLLLALVWLLPAQVATAQEPIYVALLIGSNAYQGDEDLDGLSYADDDVLRVVQTLGPLLHPDRVRILTSPDAAVAQALGEVTKHPPGSATQGGVTQGLKWLEGEVAAIRQRYGAAVEINALVFISAHGDALGVHLEDGILSGAALQDGLGTIEADNTVLIADACYASSWLVMKGDDKDTPPPPFPIHDVARAVKDLERLGVVAAQSGTREERGLIRGGMLTHMVSSALLGAADLDQDGRVLFEEMDAYLSLYGAEGDTLKRVQVMAPKKAPSLPPVLVELTRLGASGLLFPGERGGPAERFWVFDEDDRLIAEFAKEGGDSRRIWLKPGTYRVQRFTPMDSWFGEEGEILVAGGFTQVTPTLLGDSWVWAGGKGPQDNAPGGARSLSQAEIAYRSLSPVRAPISWRSLEDRDTLALRLGASNLAPRALGDHPPEDSLTQEGTAGELTFLWDRRVARVGSLYVTTGLQGVMALSPGTQVGGEVAGVGSLGAGGRLGLEATWRDGSLRGVGSLSGVSAMALGKSEPLKAYRLPLIPLGRLELSAGHRVLGGRAHIEGGMHLTWSAEAQARGDDIEASISRGGGIFGGMRF